MIDQPTALLSCPFRSQDSTGQANRSFIVDSRSSIVEMNASREYMGGGKYVMDECDTDSGDGAGRTGVVPGGDEGELIPGVLREQDRFLPIANVARIMKRAVPNNGKIAKEARECVQECVSEFISFITSEASDRCHQEKRKTINGEDILFAMSVLGFDNYVDPLKLFLQRYRESTKGERLTGNFEVDDTEIIGSCDMAAVSQQTSSQSTNGSADNGVIYTTYGSFN